MAKAGQCASRPARAKKASETKEKLPQVRVWRMNDEEEGEAKNG